MAIEQELLSNEDRVLIPISSAVERDSRHRLPWWDTSPVNPLKAATQTKVPLELLYQKFKLVEDIALLQTEGY